MELFRRWMLPALIDLLTLLLQAYLYRFLRETQWVRRSVARERLLRALYYALTAYMVLIFPEFVVPWHGVFSSPVLSWLLAGTMLWLVLLMSLGIWVKLHTQMNAKVEGMDPSRRAFLRVAAPVIALAPTAIVTAGMVRARSGPVLKEVNVRIRGLHPDLNGLRIAQLTDIHYGPFLGKRELERAVAMANETKPHVALITGDLITREGDDLHGCMNILKGVRGEAGVWACHGNHEQYAGVEDEATRLGERQGFHFLRGSNEILRFGNAKLNLSGIDYHSLGEEPLNGAEEWLASDAFNVLLSHTPAAFDRAAELGFDLTFSGHTHGGQVALPVGRDYLTFVRVYTPYIKGLYEHQGKQLYVSSGLGTVGVPVRIGADPEVTLIRLCAI
ncbi:MAG: metallophosphoesterase [Terracidiphilus sp.]|nr:metallophosphoesterase [Terracidiphilus sp.]